MITSSLPAALPVGAGHPDTLADPPPTKVDASTAAALALLPELAHRRLPARRLPHRALQTMITTITLVMVAALLTAGWSYATHVPSVRPQISTPVTPLTPHDLATYLSSADAAPGAPLVLSYHDIRPDSDSIYTVTPADFEAQMQMLDAAGYQALTIAEAGDYRAGTFEPTGHSVLITFDDGAAGLWQYADPILERYGLIAVTFVITSAPDSGSPYYLTWDEITLMQQSGRWEFGSHSHDLHTKDAPGPDRLGSALAHPVWADGVPQSLDAHRSRVEHDLDRSLAAFAEHGLPIPTTFAYPFSDVGTDSEAGEATRQAVAERFSLAFVNTNRDTQPLQVTEDTSQIIDRAEIFAGHQHREVFDRLQRLTEAAPE